MNENINLCEILKGHEGETFYSPIFGNLTLFAINFQSLEFTSIGNDTAAIESSDKFYNKADEICIFPSKDQRDWNKWIEEQKPKVPKIWNEMTSKYCNVEVWQHISHMDYGSTEPIVKSAVALLKIHQLIEASYGGLVTHSENIGTEMKHTIIPYVDNEFKYKGLKALGTCYLDNRHISFHTKEQAEEFLSYPENVQLLKDYFII